MRQHAAAPVLSVNVRPVTVTVPEKGNRRGGDEVSPSDSGSLPFREGRGVGESSTSFFRERAKVNNDRMTVETPCKPPTVCSLFREGGE